MSFLAKFFAGFGILGLVVFIIALVIGGPILTILALNALFGLGIKLTFGTYFAALWLAIVVGGGGSKVSSSR